MRIPAFVVAVILGVGTAQAATYSYQGKPMYCQTGEVCWDWGMDDDVKFITGGISLTDEYSPKKNGSMFFETVEFVGGWQMSYRIETKTGVKEATWESDKIDWSPAPFLRTGFADIFYPVAYGGALFAQTDIRGFILDWSMSGAEGGGGDWYSSPRGDYDVGYGWTSVYTKDGQPIRKPAGVWSTDGTPAIVPIPATLPLLAGALALVGMIRRRGKDRRPSL